MNDWMNCRREEGEIRIEFCVDMFFIQFSIRLLISLATSFELTYSRGKVWERKTSNPLVNWRRRRLLRDNIKSPQSSTSYRHTSSRRGESNHIVVCSSYVVEIFYKFHVISECV